VRWLLRGRGGAVAPPRRAETPLAARITQEVALLRLRFKRVAYDDLGYRWVHLPAFELPDGWSKRQTELLLVVPPAYPQLPPDGFFLDQRLTTRRGRTPGHYFQQQGRQNPYADRGWAWYCIHLDGSPRGGWHASADVLQGDNLLSYIEVIRLVLSQAARE
jgi:hypothetical protein